MCNTCIWFVAQSMISLEEKMAFFPLEDMGGKIHYGLKCIEN